MKMKQSEFLNSDFYLQQEKFNSIITIPNLMGIYLIIHKI